LVIKEPINVPLMSKKEQKKREKRQENPKFPDAKREIIELDDWNVD